MKLCSAVINILVYSENKYYKKRLYLKIKRHLKISILDPERNYFIIKVCKINKKLKIFHLSLKHGNFRVIFLSKLNHFQFTINL